MSIVNAFYEGCEQMLFLLWVELHPAAKSSIGIAAVCRSCKVAVIVPFKNES
jgi:hypothetical protein